VSSQPLIASFVVRVLHLTEADSPAWRVTVRHVQTGRETRFLKLADALAFMEACSADAPPIAVSPEE
jgi:hypothetical protein